MYLPTSEGAVSQAGFCAGTSHVVRQDGAVHCLREGVQRYRPATSHPQVTAGDLSGRVVPEVIADQTEGAVVSDLEPTGALIAIDQLHALEAGAGLDGEDICRNKGRTSASKSRDSRSSALSL